MTTPSDVDGPAPHVAGDPRVSVEDPRSADAHALISALDDFLAALYPPDNNYLLDVEALCALELTFFVARVGGMALGCGAFADYRPHPLSLLMSKRLAATQRRH